MFCPLFPTILPTISLAFVGGTIGLLLTAGIFTIFGARRMRVRRGIGLMSPGGRIGALMGQSVVHASFPVIRARAGYRSRSANGTLRKRNRIKGESARDLPNLGFKMRREKLKRRRYQ